MGKYTGTGIGGECCEMPDGIIAGYIGGAMDDGTIAAADGFADGFAGVSCYRC